MRFYVLPEKHSVYGRHPYGYLIYYTTNSGKERRVHEGGFRGEQAARRAMEAELAAIAAGEYDEAPEPEPVPDPQLNLDDELASRGLPRRDAPDPQADGS
jgi:hypothetical protein